MQFTALWKKQAFNKEMIVQVGMPCWLRRLSGTVKVLSERTGPFRRLEEDTRERDVGLRKSRVKVARQGYVQGRRKWVCRPGAGGGAQSWRPRLGADEAGVRGYRAE